MANVDGRDRQVVPDGKLCSGGLPGYKGLDLARADWPATRMTPGETLTMRYVSTIPHTGTFRMYLTKPGYDPAGPLSWSDLPEKPFAEVTDPALTDGAYPASRRPCRPTGPGGTCCTRSGRTAVRRNTYYSCSDVVFPEEKKDRCAPGEEAGEGGVAGSGEGEHPVGLELRACLRTHLRAHFRIHLRTRLRARSRTRLRIRLRPVHPHVLAGGAAAVLLLTGGAALAVRLRRR
ncbi:Chitin-binding protein OS=Streptomyces violarus OX=67380 GN=FHS41_001673 PE=4 SV=1 [Streptomyces violarus]